MAHKTKYPRGKYQGMSDSRIAKLQRQMNRVGIAHERSAAPVKSTNKREVTNNAAAASSEVPQTIKGEAPTRTKVIDYSCEGELDEFTQEAIKTTEQFLIVISRAQDQFKRQSDSLSYYDRKITDLLHEVELLPAMNACDGYTQYKKLREARIARRSVKNSHQLLGFLMNVLDNNKEVQDQLNQAVASIMWARSKQEHASYTYRTDE